MIAGTDPIRPSALSVPCPWCGTSAGLGCDTPWAGRDYHAARADAGLKSEFPNITGDGGNQ